MNAVAISGASPTTAEQRQQQLERLAEADRLMDELAPSLGELRAKSSEMERLITDPSLRSNIADRVAQTERAADELRAKIESVKNAATVGFFSNNL